MKTDVLNCLIGKIFELKRSREDKFVIFDFLLIYNRSNEISFKLVFVLTKIERRRSESRFQHLELEILTNLSMLFINSIVSSCSLLKFQVTLCVTMNRIPSLSQPEMAGLLFVMAASLLHSTSSIEFLLKRHRKCEQIRDLRSF